MIIVTNHPKKHNPKFRFWSLVLAALLLTGLLSFVTSLARNAEERFLTSGRYESTGRSGSLPTQTEPATIPTPPTKSACSDIPENECAALFDLYLESNGSNWHDNDGWFVAPSVCQWYGITCKTSPAILSADADIGNNHPITHVVSLDLSWNNLGGLLPASIVQLTELEVLNLSGNNFSGAIPATLGALQNLQILNLSENRFDGQLPPELGSLLKLRVLHLFENQLFGLLPLELADLTALNNFKFQNTNLCVPVDALFEQWLDDRYAISRTAPGDCVLEPNTPRPLLMIYAVFDNDLGSEWEQLVNASESGMRGGGFDVKLLIDGPGNNNAYEYFLQADTDSGCPSLVANDLDCNRYQLRKTLRLQNENTAHRDTLSSFIINSTLEYPNATKHYLMLVGHGAGWGASALPSQPPIWRELSGEVTDTAGGMLWDSAPSTSISQTASLSTRALGLALQRVAQTTGRKIDLLYLDACSMAMAEVAYELRDSVHYLLASSNTKWSTFPYDKLLADVAIASDPADLGKRWINHEVALLNTAPGHAYTFSLTDLDKITAVMSATNQLAVALSSTLPSQLNLLRQAGQKTAHFDSNYDGELTDLDAYLDLYDYAFQVEQLFAGNAAVTSAAHAVQDAMQAAVIQKISNSDGLWASNAPTFTWQHTGGLSIYLPLTSDEPRRNDLYNAINLMWVKDSQWGAFLQRYWAIAGGTPPPSLAICPSVTSCPSLSGWGAPTWHVFVPHVEK